MKTHAKSHNQNKPGSLDKKQSRDTSSPKSEIDTGEHISTDSSKEDTNKPKRLGESPTEINDDTTV